MDGNPIVIRKSKKKLFLFLLLTGGMITWFFVDPYEKNRKMFFESPVFTLILGIIFFSGFIYYLVELIRGKPEIVISDNGIEIREKGFYEWASIRSFKTIQEHGMSTLSFRA